MRIRKSILNWPTNLTWSYKTFQLFENCSCIPTSHGDIDEISFGSATLGQCLEMCATVIPYAIIYAICGFCMALSQNPNYMVTLRYVSCLTIIFFSRGTELKTRISIWSVFFHRSSVWGREVNKNNLLDGTYKTVRAAFNFWAPLPK